MVDNKECNKVEEGVVTDTGEKETKDKVSAKVAKKEEALKKAAEAERLAEEEKNKADERAVDIVLSIIKKKYGDVINPLSAGVGEIRTVSTGSLGLDLALGRGGMALGRIYEVFGPPSSGKSTLGINVIVQAQRRNMRCAYLDAEMAVDPELFKNYGVDAEKLELVQVYGGEPNLDILERLIKTGIYDVIVVDSVSALIPMVEAEADISKDHMALQARLMSKALRKITPQASETNTLLIFVNQIRKTLAMWGPSDTTSGGESLAFYATGRISMKGPEAKSRRVVDPVSGDTLGHMAEHEIVKNKLAEPFRKATLKLIYGKGYDFYWEVLQMATSLNVIEKAGSWFKFHGENIGQGELSVLELFKSNSKIFNEVRDEIMTLTGQKEAYVAHGNPGPLHPHIDISGLPF